MNIDSTEAVRISEHAIKTTGAYEHLKTLCRKATKANLALRPATRNWWNRGNPGRVNKLALDDYLKMMKELVSDLDHSGANINYKATVIWLKVNT